MKLKINVEGKEKEIEIKSLKGRQQKQGFKLYTNIAKKGEENVDALDTYLDYLDNLAAELTGMKVDELDELDCEEKDKIIRVIQERIQGKIDFLKSSQKLLKSEAKETPQS